MVIRDKGTGDYYNPDTNSWGGFKKFDVTITSPGATSTTITQSFTPPPGGSGEYRARIFTSDAANNDSNVKNVDFEVTGGGPDTEIPVTEWTNPPNNSTRSAPVTLRGDITDNIGVVNVKMVIRDTGTGDYYNPDTNSWGGFKRFDVAVNSPGSTSTSFNICLLYTSPSPRDATLSRMPSSA